MSFGSFQKVRLIVIYISKVVFWRWEEKGKTHQFFLCCSKESKSQSFVWFFFLKFLFLPQRTFQIEVAHIKILI